MNDKISKLPKFKYHPNIYDKEKVLDGVRFDNNVCQCCGNKTDVYVSTMYCCENIDCICMECVANGKAAEKYDGEFIQDAEKISDEKKRVPPRRKRATRRHTTTRWAPGITRYTSSRKADRSSCSPPRNHGRHT